MGEKSHSFVHLLFPARSSLVCYPWHTYLKRVHVDNHCALPDPSSSPPLPPKELRRQPQISPSDGLWQEFKAHMVEKGDGLGDLRQMLGSKVRVWDPFKR